MAMVNIIVVYNYMEVEYSSYVKIKENFLGRPKQFIGDVVSWKWILLALFQQTVLS